jgi:hypothetical protein
MPYLVLFLPLLSRQTRSFPGVDFNLLYCFESPRLVPLDSESKILYTEPTDEIEAIDPGRGEPGRGSGRLAFGKAAGEFTGGF